MKNLSETLLLAARGAIFGAIALGATSVLAWNPAPASPPSSNAAAPLNVSATPQVKAGTITINGAGTMVVTPSSNAGWAANIQSASLNGLYADNNSGVYGELANNIYSLYGNGNVYIVSTAASGWAGYFDGINGVYGINAPGNWGALGYSSYGGFFHGVGGAYAENTSGMTTWLAYPGSATYGVYTNGSVYANDVYDVAAGRWLSTVTNGGLFTYYYLNGGSGPFCHATNPQTNACSCPAGYTGKILAQSIQVVSNDRWLVIYQCY